MYFLKGNILFHLDFIILLYSDIALCKINNLFLCLSLGKNDQREIDFSMHSSQ